MNVRLIDITDYKQLQARHYIKRSAPSFGRDRTRLMRAQKRSVLFII